MAQHPMVNGQRYNHYGYGAIPGLLCPFCDQSEPCSCPKYRAEAINLECEQCGALMGQHLAAGPLLCPAD